MATKPEQSEAAGEVDGNIAWLMVAAFVFVAVGSLHNSLVSYGFAISKSGDHAVNLIVSSYFAGFMAGAFLAPSFTGRLGYVWAFLTASLLTCGCCFLLASGADTLSFWITTQILTGAAIALQYVVVESWLNLVTRARSRARLFSIYMLVWFLAAGAAPLLMQFAKEESSSLFMVLAFASLLAGFIVVKIRRSAPQVASHISVPLLPVVRASRLGFAGTLIAGASFAAALGLTSAYGHQKGFDLEQVSVFVAAFVFGGACLQYPVGWASDYYGRYPVILAVAGAAAVAAFALGMVSGYAASLFWAFLLGGFSMSIYALAVSLVHDNLPQQERLSASGGLLLLNGAGSFLGPLIVSAISVFAAGEAMAFTLCFVHLLLGGYVICSRRRLGLLRAGGQTHSQLQKQPAGANYRQLTR